MKLAPELPSRASYTQMSAFQRCKFRYWLKYVLGAERVTKSVGLLRGSVLHEAYDRYMFTGRKDHKVAFETVVKKAQEEVNNGADPETVQQVEEEANLVLEHYLPWADENDNWELVLPVKKQKQCETSGTFDIPLPDGTTYPFHFKIDAHIKVDGTRMMLENKFRKNLDSSGLEHDLQILLYQAAWNALHPKQRLEGVVYNIVSAKPRKKDGKIAVREFYYRGPQEEEIGLRNAGAIILEMRQQMQGKVWPMTQKKDCNWDCDFVGMCLAARSGAPVLDMIDGVSYRLNEHARERNAETEEE